MDKNKDKGERLRERELHTKEARDEFGTEAGEDATKYGEFVCSYFAWLKPEEQKEKVEKLEDITKRTPSPLRGEPPC